MDGPLVKLAVDVRAGGRSTEVISNPQTTVIAMLADLPPLYRSVCLQALIGQTLSLGELAPEVETIIATIQEQSNLTPLELDLIDRLQYALAQGQVLQGAWVPIRV